MSPFTPRRARLAGILLLAGTFAAGMLSGTAFGRVLTAGEPQPAAEPECERRRGPEMIFDALDLSADQRARVGEIMSSRRARTDSLWRADGARLRAVVDSTRAEIRAVLTPEQRAEYDRLRAEREARHRERSGHGGDGAPGGERT
jgi:Spy/CpxP family protein refolding chaperone